MIKQFGLPNFVIWLFLGIAVVFVALLAVFKLLIGAIALVLAAIVAYFGYYFFFRPAFRALDIMKKGEPAIAVIIKAWQTGITIDNNPRLGLLLEVRPPNMVPYEVEIRHNVKKNNLNLFQSGRTVPVKIDSKNPKKVAIEKI